MLSFSHQGHLSYIRLQQQARGDGASTVSAADYTSDKNGYVDWRREDDGNTYDMRSTQHQALERMSSHGNGGTYGSSQGHDYLGYSTHGDDGHGTQWDDADSNMFDGL